VSEAEAISAVLAAAAAVSIAAALITSLRTNRAIAQSKPPRKPRQKRPAADVYFEERAKRANQSSSDFLTKPTAE
jgi:hypothetical protein